MDESSFLVRAWSGGEANFKTELEKMVKEEKFGRLTALKQYLCFSAENSRFFSCKF